jgi:hypothetical protein
VTDSRGASLTARGREPIKKFRLLAVGFGDKIERRFADALGE